MKDELTHAENMLSKALGSARSKLVVMSMSFSEPMLQAVRARILPPPCPASRMSSPLEDSSDFRL